MCKSQHREKGNMREEPGHYKIQQLLNMHSSEGEIKEITDIEFKDPANE
jgi:hypothetical protein